MFLKFLFQAHKNQRVAVLSHLTKTQIDVLSEIALNIYRGVFPNKQKYVKSLKPFRSTVFYLGSKTVSRRDKKEILLRHNGLIPSLVRPVLDFL